MSASTWCFCEVETEEESAVWGEMRTVFLMTNVSVELSI